MRCLGEVYCLISKITRFSTIYWMLFLTFFEEAILTFFMRI